MQEVFSFSFDGFTRLRTLLLVGRSRDEVQA
jgi:hypothetical protein